MKRPKNSFNFQHKATALLSDLLDNIDEAEMDDEVLFIHIGTRPYVLNKHRIKQEIWLASPISGPHHFSYHNGRWISKKHNIDLIELLNKELELDLSYE